MLIHEHMLAKAKQAQQAAYAPYSNFPVGVCLRTHTDTLFSGGNVENASYGLSLCAEATAIGQMVTAGFRQITEMVIVGPTTTPILPCGRCRQLIQEFAVPETRIHLGQGDRLVHAYSIAELLPYAFTHHLLDKK